MTEWIPTKERLPNKDMLCLITVKNMVPPVMKASYHVFYVGKEHYWWCNEIRCDVDNKRVLAWMPLPKPYEEDE